jgi:hypothetical protein
MASIVNLSSFSLERLVGGHRQLVGCGQQVDWAKGDGDLHHSGNAADFCPDLECLRPGGSVLGGSEVIAAEVKRLLI